MNTWLTFSLVCSAFLILWMVPHYKSTPSVESTELLPARTSSTVEEAKMIKIKRGVDLRLLTPQVLLAVAVAESLFFQRDIAVVITSGRDSRHGKGSLHYMGNAVDLRIRALTAFNAAAVAEELADCLGDQYDVVLESDHIHVEFDPK